MGIKANHHCIICGTGYYHCNDCDKMKSFTPWRKVACSTECYQTYLAFMEYRDFDHDAKKFAEQVDQIGIDVQKLPAPLYEVYEAGKGVEIENKLEGQEEISEFKANKTTRRAK